MRKKDVAYADASQQDGTQSGQADTGNTICKDKRGVSVMSKRMHEVVVDVILPMSKDVGALPRATNFFITEYDSLCAVLCDVVKKDCPSLITDRDKFLLAVGNAYDQTLGAGMRDGAADRYAQKTR